MGHCPREDDHQVDDYPLHGARTGSRGCQWSKTLVSVFTSVCDQVVSNATYLFILQGEVEPSHRSLETFVKWMNVSNAFSFPLARCTCVCCCVGAGIDGVTEMCSICTLDRKKRETGEFQLSA